jgi:hypothetical protein
MSAGKVVAQQTDDPPGDEYSARSGLFLLRRSANQCGPCKHPAVCNTNRHMYPEWNFVMPWVIVLANQLAVVIHCQEALRAQQTAHDEFIYFRELLGHGGRNTLVFWLQIAKHSADVKSPICYNNNNVLIMKCKPPS